MNVLVNHPYFGSLWLNDAEIKKGQDGKDYVVGWVWDKSDVGHPNMPDDYTGQPMTMNFPVSCIRKKEE